MRSFTATCRLGTVRVRFHDTNPPEVWQSGRIVARGVPEVTDDPDHPGLVCRPLSEWGSRKVTSLTAGDTTLTDVTAGLALGVFAVDGLPPLFGAEVNERNRTVRGLVFADGEMEVVQWDLVLSQTKKPCCGRKADTTPPPFDVPTLAFPEDTRHD